MSDRKRIEELERRVRELEARPIAYPAIVIVQPPTTVPTPHFPTWPWYPVQSWPNPWPVITYSAS